MKILATILLAITFTACGDCENVSDAVCKASKAGGGVILSTESSQVTPNGVKVRGNSSVSPSQLQLIDAGITGAVADARISGYARDLNYDHFAVYTPPYRCEPSPEQRVPSFLVRADSYDGSEFDQYNSKGVGVKDNIGVVYAAEMVLDLGTNGNEAQMYVCPDASHLKDAVRHGAEHQIIASNDNDYFNLTWYHGDGFYHPLLPKRTNLRETPRRYDGKILIRAVK